MTILLGIGIALVVFGGLVLLRFPDRTNGTGLGGGPSRAAADTGGTSGSNGCLGSVFHGIPAGRIRTVAEGASGLVVTPGGESTTGPIGLRLTDRGTPVGGLAVEYVASGQLFRVSAAVDARCRPAANLEDVDRPSQDPHVLQNWDTLQLRLGRSSYDLRIGSSPAIEVSFSRAAS